MAAPGHHQRGGSPLGTTQRRPPSWPVAGATGGEMSGRQIDARRRVNTALDALGGHDSPAGSCVWFVVGLEMSVREWAARRGWSGRPVPQPIAGGILVAALGILAMHFGLTPRQ